VDVNQKTIFPKGKRLKEMKINHQTSVKSKTKERELISGVNPHGALSQRA
jgi:hypothetical protein